MRPAEWAIVSIRSLLKATLQQVRWPTLKSRPRIRTWTAVRRFAQGVSAVTFEFENVPAITAKAAAEFAPVRPDGMVLHTTQNRLREKSFLASHGLPVTPFRKVEGLQDLQSALEELGCPAVLKTAGYGYDGKGQITIDSPAAGSSRVGFGIGTGIGAGGPC